MRRARSRTRALWSARLGRRLRGVPACRARSHARRRGYRTAGPGRLFDRPGRGVPGRARTGIPRILRCRPIPACGALRVLARLSPAHARRDRPGQRLARPGPAAVGSPCARLRRAGLSAAAGSRAAPRIRRLRRCLRRRGRGRRNRRAMSRRGSDRLRPASAGADSIAARADPSRPCAPGRDHARGHSGRAVAPRHGLDVLQRDRGLPTGLCARPQPRVDRRHDPMVRGPARYGRLRRRVPGASGGNHAASRRLAGCDRASPARPRAVRGRRPPGLRRRALPASGSPSSERRFRCGRGGVSRSKPTGL